MAHVAVGVPVGVESRMVKTQDGEMERLRFKLAHPLTANDEYPEVFQVGQLFAEDIREAAASGTLVAVAVRFKEKEAGKNGDRDLYFWKCEAVDVG